MLKLILIGTVGTVFILTAIIIIRNKPDFWFWIFLNLSFDPGGYVYAFLDGRLGPLPIADLSISGMILCMYFARINWKTIFQDAFLNKFLILLFLFYVYYFVVYGAVVPLYHNDLNYSIFLVKNREYAYSFIMLIAVYAFSIRSMYYFYTSTLFFGVISLTLFFISVLTGADLSPVEQEARYTGGDMMRISMIGYGIFSLLFPVSIITYILSKKVKFNLNYKSWLYYSGIIFTLAQLITLTRRVQIDLISTLILLTLIISYILRIGKLSSLLKTIVPALLVLLVLYFTFPKYVGFITNIGQDTLLLITTGEDSRGQSDQRLSGDKDYELVDKYIEDNLFFGTGYTYLYWQDGIATSVRGEEYSRARDAAGEVNIYFLFFAYGLVGALLMLTLYFLMIKLFFKLVRLLRVTLFSLLNEPLTIIFAIYILFNIAAKFTYQLWGLSSDFTGSGMGYTAILMGVGIALLRKTSMIAKNDDNFIFNL